MGMKVNNTRDESILLGMGMKVNNTRDMKVNNTWDGYESK